MVEFQTPFFLPPLGWERRGNVCPVIVPCHPLHFGMCISFLAQLGPRCIV